MNNVNADMLLTFLVVGSALLSVYNVIMAAINNHNSSRKQRNAPVDGLKDTVKEHEKRIAYLEVQTADIKKGQRALVYGVQALLEHELHNGNAQQMQTAADGLNNWLVGRKGE